MIISFLVGVRDGSLSLQSKDNENEFHGAMQAPSKDTLPVFTCFSGLDITLI
jgi:hypothetical protein